MIKIKHSAYLVVYLLYFLMNGQLTEIGQKIFVGTFYRYVIAFLFNFVSCSEYLVSKYRIQDKNPPREQMEREDDWDNALILSVISFTLVELFTPFFNTDSPLSPKTLFYCFIVGHYCGLTY